MKNIQTLCLIIKDSKILLGFKKVGLGAGRWNGFGGKVELGEQIEEGAKRELKEEAGIEAGDLKKNGILEFEFKNNPEILEVHIFKIDNFSGEPKESDEMMPKWFHIAEMPYDKMWKSDAMWLPIFLRGEKFRGKFSYDDSHNLIDGDLSIVENL